MRPISIVNFERCYLGALLIGLVNTVLSFPAMLRMPQVAQATATLGTSFIYISAGIGIIISLLLWYFAARRASVVAKWIIVVFFAFGVLGMVRNLLTGFPTSLSGVLAIVAFVLQAVGVYLLFKPDANAWFRGERTNLADTFA